jgi:predicted GNAT family acetyltransferase
MDFIRDDSWIYSKDENGNVVAEVTFPVVEAGVVMINHTFVDDTLRGQGVAAMLMEEAYSAIKENGQKAIVTCPYAVSWYGQNPQKNDIVKEIL